MQVQEKTDDRFVEANFIQAEIRLKRPQGQTPSDALDEGDRPLIIIDGPSDPAPCFGDPGQAEGGLPANLFESQAGNLSGGGPRPIVSANDRRDRRKTIQ